MGIGFRANQLIEDVSKSRHPASRAEVVLGKEECDPPGEGCTEECRLKEGWEWVPLESLGGRF